MNAKHKIILEAPLSSNLHKKAHAIYLMDPKAKLAKLPTKSKIFTVIRGPHVNNKSREHFQYQKHKWAITTQLGPNLMKHFLSKHAKDPFVSSIYLRNRKYDVSLETNENKLFHFGKDILSKNSQEKIRINSRSNSSIYSWMCFILSG